MTQPAQLSTWPGFDRTHHSMLTKDNSVPRARPWKISKSFTKASRPELVPWSIFFVADSGNFKTHLNTFPHGSHGVPPLLATHAVHSQDRGLSYGESFQTLDQRDRLQRPGGLGQVVQPLRQHLGETWRAGKWVKISKLGTAKMAGYYYKMGMSENRVYPQL